MGGVLQFTLGLEVADFLQKANISSGVISGLAGAGEALHRAFEKVFESFERGAGLEHLSKRTGETAGNLYRLQAGLEACGVSAESLPSMLFLMQKALGGLSEMGESTSDVFHKLGLNIGDLKRQGPAEAFAQILDRLGQLSPDAAAKASSMIFGRMGAGNALQVARSGGEFSSAFADAARQADIIQRAGAAFERIQRTINSIKREMVGFWTALAEGAAPAVQSILDWLRKIDLTSIGKRIGQWFNAMTEAFKDGSFSEMLALSLQVGFEKGTHWANRFALSLAAAVMASLPHAITAGLELGKIGARSLGEWSLKFGVATLEKSVRSGEARKAADPANWSRLDEGNLQYDREHLANARSQLENVRADFASKNTASLRAMITEGQAAIDGAVKAAWEAWSASGSDAPSEAQKRLQALMGRFGTAMGRAAVVLKPGDDDVSFGAGLTHRTEGNVFEKMGFVMGGGGGPLQDVAQNTRRTADAVDALREAILEQWQRGDVAQPGMDHAVL